MENTYNSVIYFFDRNKYIILAAFAVGIFSHSLSIFTFKFGIDAEGYALAGSADTYLMQQRWGTYVLQLLFPFLKYHIVSQIFGIAMLTLSAVLTVSRHNISNIAKIIFCISAVSYPAPAFLEFFYFQSGYNFTAVFLSVIAYKMIETDSKFTFIPAILILAVSIASYQSVIAVFLTVLMINMLLDYINGKSFSYIFKFIVKSTILLIISVIVYYIIVKLLPYKISGYLTGFYKYGSDDITEVFKKLLKDLAYIMASRYNYTGTANIVSLIAICAMWIIAALKWKNIKKTSLFMILTFGLLLAVFSVNIMLGSYLPIRSMISLAFFFGTPYILILAITENKILKWTVTLIGIYCALIHINFINKQYTAHLLQYETDRVISQRILDGIYNTAPEIYDGKHKIAFIGKIENPARHNMQQGYETFGRSFYEWDNGNPNRMIRTLYLFGLPMNVKLANGEEMNRAKEIAENMPQYPDKDCIILDNNIVIVNLR